MPSTPKPKTTKRKSRFTVTKNNTKRKPMPKPKPKSILKKSGTRRKNSRRRVKFQSNINNMLLSTYRKSRMAGKTNVSPLQNLKNMQNRIAKNKNIRRRNSSARISHVDVNKNNKIQTYLFTTHHFNNGNELMEKFFFQDKNGKLMFKNNANKKVKREGLDRITFNNYVRKNAARKRSRKNSRK